MGDNVQKLNRQWNEELERSFGDNLFSKLPIVLLHGI
jgi:hypothetical protein